MVKWQVTFLKTTKQVFRPLINFKRKSTFTFFVVVGFYHFGGGMGWVFRQKRVSRVFHKSQIFNWKFGEVHTYRGENWAQDICFYTYYDSNDWKRVFVFKTCFRFWIASRISHLDLGRCLKTSCKIIKAMEGTNVINIFCGKIRSQKSRKTYVLSCSTMESECAHW